MTGVQTVEIAVRGVLFDMDGVLMSSLGSVERSWNRYAASRGVDPELAIRLAHGRRAIETVHLLRPDLDPQEELGLVEAWEIADGEGIAVLPGVHDLLAALPKNSWAIVTSATERLARSRLASVGIPIPEHLITSETVNRGKPHPEPYLHAARLIGAEARDCVVIEDSPAGVASGKAAGCRVLAVLTTHSAESLAAADWRVPTLAAVRVNAENDAVALHFTPFENI